MIVPAAYQDKRVGVFGLGTSGRAAARALAVGRAEVAAWDDNPAARHDGNIPLNDLYAADFGRLDALVVAPGVPLTHPAPHPLVAKASEHKVPVIGDIELFASCRRALPNHRVAAVTGTNGKSTTAALLAHVLSEGGLPTALGGNIGTPVLDLDPLPAGGIYVLEISSFQIDLTRTLGAEVAILLNITPDHLDRHGDMAGYARSKRRLFDMQDDEAIAIVAVDDAWSREIADGVRGRLIRVSAEGALEHGVYVSDGRFFDALGERPHEIANLSDLKTLRGRHNWQNAAAVYAAARSLGVSAEVIAAGFQTFPGLAHRLEQVTSSDGVLFVNDSKASNTAAAARALEAFDDVYWIAGGRFKEESLDPLATSLGHVRHAYLIGEAAERFEEFLRDRVPVTLSGTLDAAVHQAAKDAARSGGVVLLAPACASFDQFENFAARGEAFRLAALREAGGGGQ